MINDEIKYKCLTDSSWEDTNLTTTLQQNNKNVRVIFQSHI